MSSDADVLRARRMLDDMQSKLTESRRMIEETQRQCATAIGASASIDAQWKAIQDKFSLVMATAIGQLSTAFAAELDVSTDEKLDSEDRVKQSAAVLERGEDSRCERQNHSLHRRWHINRVGDCRLSLWNENERANGTGSVDNRSDGEDHG